MENADGSDHRCGQVAAVALDELLEQKNVSCSLVGRHWERIVAICYAGDEDLGGWMVKQGHAVNDDRYDPGYWWHEILAWWQDQGVWAGSFERPRSWRGR